MCCNMNKKLIICYLLLIASLSVMARRRKVLNLHKTPWYRSLEPDITTTDEDEEVKVSKVPAKSKLYVIKPRNYDEADEGRFLKHILLYKSFLQPQTNSPSYMMPYLIINNPTNLTNINNNTLNNVPAAGTVTAGTGGGTGGGGTGGGVRIAYIRDSQALPYPLPTQVYQQRQQVVPQVVYGYPLNSGNQNKQNRFGNGNGNANGLVFQNPNNRNSNPFSNFANSFRRVQFF